MSHIIGRGRYARETYPEAARGGGAASLLQVGSDLLSTNFAVTGGGFPLKVEKTVGVLLEVPLLGFRRVNGLWIQMTVDVDREDTGDVVITTFPWIKFSTLPQYFAPATTPMIATVSMAEVPGVEAPTQPFTAITLTLTALFQIPAQSGDEVPIPFPAVDDILVGITGSGQADFQFTPTTIMTAGEMDASIITQMPTVPLITLP